jgi:hypothetical protein
LELAKDAIKAYQKAIKTESSANDKKTYSKDIKEAPKANKKVEAGGSYY